MNSFFVERFKRKTTEELEKMLANPDSFQPNALEAARYILEQRKAGNEEFAEPVRIIEDQKSNKRPFFSKVNTSIYSVAVYQLLTSLFFLPIIFNNLAFNFSFTDNLSNLLEYNIGLLVFYTVYITNIIASVQLFRKRRNGIIISMILQVFQSIHLSAFGLLISISTIFNLIPGIKINDGFQFSFAFNLIGGSSNFSFNAEGFYIGINLVSLVCFIVLDKALQKTKGNIISDEIMMEDQLKE